MMSDVKIAKPWSASPPGPAAVHSVAIIQLHSATRAEATKGDLGQIIQFRPETRARAIPHFTTVAKYTEHIFSCSALQL